MSESNEATMEVDDLIKHRLESLQQENIVLKSELETMKLKIRALQEENLQLRKNSVNIQVRAEQEEEYISNKLLKKITELKKEKETLALNYEQEEEFLTNDLSRKLSQLRDEKANLEKTLEKEQELQISKLMSRIQKLENDVILKQKNLDTLRREKVELENALEQEQEGLVNRLWKKMEKLESEKRMLQSKLDVSLSPMLSGPSSTTGVVGLVRQQQHKLGSECDQMEVGSQNNQCSGEDEDIESLLSGMSGGGETPASAAASVPTAGMTSDTVDKAGLVQSYIWRLREEVARLRAQVVRANDECEGRLRGLGSEEKALQEENRRLRKRLQAEMERREDMCRNLSESESSLEIDEERHFNELRKSGVSGSPGAHLLATEASRNRARTASDSSGCLMLPVAAAPTSNTVPSNIVPVPRNLATPHRRPTSSSSTLNTAAPSQPNAAQ